ncbi:unnamed protein product [Allacma fusca]|uniref:Uncharacterized protein n=1 Tax=Allacma fusca TaxID=39272 RepID=A0A8J2JFZ6_9HEXA|nr:unnamed protein product [Allacma fusca]
MGISLMKYDIVLMLIVFNGYPDDAAVLPADTLMEYANDLKWAPDYLSKALDDSKKQTHSPSKQTKCPECGVGLIKSVKWFRIVTNLPRNEYPIMEYLNQWMHILIESKLPLKGLIVQANVNPYGMAYGNFDLEFGCKDCLDPDLNLEDASQGKALELANGNTTVIGANKAAAIPCRRRTYLHVRHPNVYVYAHDTSRTQFHMNYNYLDITCRQTQMIQLMFLVIPRSGKRDYSKTGVIDHGFVDSPDGMPYPYHVDFRKSFNCHTVKIHFRLVANGEKTSIRINDDYDACTLASKKDYKKKWRDEGSMFISNKVCRYPMRSKCDHDDINNQSPGVTDPSKADSSACEDCTDDDNEFTREALRRLIRRSYMTRRVHGIAMIIGLIAIGNITIHLARYWKETGGGCLLVGWWLWAHLGLMYAAKLSIYIGLVLGICQSPRLPAYEEFDIDTKRDQVIIIHKIVGGLAVVLFHVECLMGPWRPSAAGLRFILILVHAICGYLSVVLAFAAVLLSTACFEIVVVTLMSGVVQSWEFDS